MKVAEKPQLKLQNAVSSNENLPIFSIKYFGFPLNVYGIKDQKASGEIIHSVNPSGDYELFDLLHDVGLDDLLALIFFQVIYLFHTGANALFLAPEQMKLKIICTFLRCLLLSCKVLLKLAGDDLSTTPTIIVPCVVPDSKLKQENKYSMGSDNASVYGIELGPKRDLTEALSSKLQKPSPCLQVYREDLATLLHLLTAMKLPAVVLIGQSGQRVASKNSKDELEVICQIGEHLASISGLLFSKDKTVQNPPKKSRDNKEAWHALYG
ncbi:ATP synthase subunit a [Striga asiatica]|uniref:ATP synthase subunit a n=1 Tax=Striga asiatica TaxID=4170 RepID=A0A5A7RBN8_STRAF|nr:ATP synthase subunit a [Striga asiatica]